MIDQALADAGNKMDKAIEVAKEDLATIRTGRANAAMFNKVVAEYYGTPTPLQQLASFSVPEARVILIAPFDKENDTTLPTLIVSKPTFIESHTNESVDKDVETIAPVFDIVKTLALDVFFIVSPRLCIDPVVSIKLELAFIAPELIVPLVIFPQLSVLPLF